MKKLILFSLIVLVASAFTTTNVSPPEPKTNTPELVLVTMVDAKYVNLIPTVDQVNAVEIDKTVTPCVCTAPFQRSIFPWSSTWYRQCYNTGGDHEIWTESGSCNQSSCFPNNGCGATASVSPSDSFLKLNDKALLASTSNDIVKYQEAEVVAGCTCPQDWFWQPGWIWGGYWVRQCMEYRGDDVWLVNFTDQSSQNNKPTYNPCNN